MTSSVQIGRAVRGFCTALNVNSARSVRTLRESLDRYDTFMFDCDGVLWQNDHITAIPGVTDAIEKLKSLNKKLIYVTNNSITSRMLLEKKFKGHGFSSQLDHIFSNGYVSAIRLKEILKEGEKVYMVGGVGLKSELDHVGVENLGCGPDPHTPTSDVDELLKMPLDDSVKAVLVGFDEHFSYNKIFKAATYISRPDCHFFATNCAEKRFRIGELRNERIMPMTVMVVDAIAGTGHREPVVIGKPNKTMFDCVKKIHPEVDERRTVFIGDSLNADIAFASNVGIDSALVLSGVTSIEDLGSRDKPAPNYVMQSLADIVD